MKTGKNDPCNCGSGRRYQDCCPGKIESRTPPTDELDLLVALFNTGQHMELESRARALLEQYPDSGVVWNLLGISLQSQGKDALLAMQKAAELLPGDAAAHSNLGAILKGHGRLAEAELSYRHALRLDPDFAVAHSNLGNVLREQNKLEEAEASTRRALDIKPDYAEAHNNLSVILQKLGRLVEAETSGRRALELNPANAEAHYNLGVTLHEMGRFATAETSYRRAIALKPGFVEAYNNLGVTLREQGRLNEAEASYRRALEIDPDYANAADNLLFAMNYSASHNAADRLAEARRYGAMVAKKVTTGFSRWQCDDQPERLRVGLVSGDLLDHPVGYFIESLLAQLDLERVEMIAYQTDPRDSALTTRIKPYFTEWKQLSGLSDEAAAKLIHADGVHVLLDLSGHTGHSRLPVFAWKPAPVQASWLGYFATTGVAEMDYFLADEVGVPTADSAHFTETVWYLPDTRLCFTPPDVDLPVAALPASRNGYITYACFQRLDKVGDEVLTAWASILKKLPNARLRWQCKQLSDPAVVQLMIQRLQRHGIDPARVTLHGEFLRKEYLVVHAQVDMILDTFPYPGGTTTCEALWMGVPTLTLAGGTLLARQGASLLTAAGLADWITTSVADYVEQAVRFASDISGLAELRARLREQVQASPLFDAPRFARNMEAALWGMWQARSPDRIEPSKRGDAMNEVSTFLHVGCGPKHKQQTTRTFNSADWHELRLDIDAGVTPDIIGSMTDMSAVKDASVDAVFSSHNIEHLYPHEVSVALKEFLRVLRPGGFLVLTCPDLQSVCALVAEDKLTEPARSSPAGPIAPIDILYGYRPALAQGNLYMAHRCGFTQKVLTATLQANGFAMVAAARRAEPHFDIWAVASKSAIAEEELRQLALKHFPL